MIEHTAAAAMVPYLLSTGLVVTPGSTKPFPLFLNDLPTSPDRAVVISDTDGVDNGRDMRGTRSRYPGVQIMIRALKNGEGSQLGLRIINALDALLKYAVTLPNEEHVDRHYLLSSFQRTSDVLPLGQEEGTSRLLFTVNGLLTYGEILP
jgi:hypothetical protein